MTEINGLNHKYRGDTKLLIGILLSVFTFGLFAQTMLNTATTIRLDLGSSVELTNTAVSLTALFSGLFIVVFGSLGDRVGKLKIMRIGLFLSMIGSLLIALSPQGTAVFLLAGRIVQGLSAACILPNALALTKIYFEGEARQRAVSVYSVGAWGGAALSSLFGGFLASTVGWRWIYWASIAVAIVALFLIAKVPESKQASDGAKQSYDIPGAVTFVIGILALNIMISQGGQRGWLHPLNIGLALLTIVALVVFYKIEAKKDNAFIDLNLFKEKTFTGATISNFMLNATAGSLTVALSLVQIGADLSPLEAGYLTIGYAVGILIAIKVGEKMLQKRGARLPMILGSAFTGLGIFMNSFTNIMTSDYIIVATIGFTFFGIGLGLYATPSADVALSSISVEKSGSASGIYRMAASLGAAIGIAISSAIFTGISDSPLAREGGFYTDIVGRTDNISLRYAATLALFFNIFLTLLAIISIMATIPSGKGKTKD
ncbi:MAG: MFS transporter [Eubacteriales bacterium]|nr:MFS transporter [Eubacteriales bacterium]